MKTQNLKSQKIRILHKINKKDILNRNVRLLKKYVYFYAPNGWAFCMNYCINAVWHGGNQSVALLGCNRRFSMGFRSGEFAGQSSTVTPWSLNLPSPAGEGNQHLHKACQQKEA